MTDIVGEGAGPARAGPARAREARARSASGRAHVPNPLLSNIEAERRTRPRAVPGPAPTDAIEPAPRGTGDQEQVDDVAGAATAPAQQPGAHGAVCTIGLCPICTLVTAFGEARPELTEHLLLAGRELLVAMKVLIDARLQHEEPPAPGGGLERISIE